MSTKDHVNRIIDSTFQVIIDVYKKQKEVGGVLIDTPLSRIVFPKKRMEPVRVSEQELRFIFVEQLNEEIRRGWDVFYSVETPTLDKYYFKNNEARIDDNGQSASFDLAIHDKDYQRIALVEFKANNAGEHEHRKDYVKLMNSKEGENIACFFIEIVQGVNSGTINSLNSKIPDNEDVVFRCFSLEEGKEITDEVLE